MGATLGCMLGVSRRYVAEDWLSRRRGNNGNTAAVDSMRTAAVDSNESEGRPSCEPGAAPPEVSRTTRRSADIVIEPWMRLARVTKCEEGKRAVTGARKLEVWIEGLADEDPSGPGFVPAVASVAAHPAGTSARKRRVAVTARMWWRRRRRRLRGSGGSRRNDKRTSRCAWFAWWGWRTATGSSIASPRWSSSAGGESPPGDASSARARRSVYTRYVRYWTDCAI